MPSVMTTASPMPASTASMTAAFANGGGTKMTLTSAPVSFMASATPPKTGTLVPSKSTLVPALRGLTPPTMAVPEASMRCVCLLPSEPVMPWTMTLLFSLRRIDILVSCPESWAAVRRRRVRRPGARRRPSCRPRSPADGWPRRGCGGPLRRLCAGGGGGGWAALFGVVAVEADDERLRRLVAEDAQGRDDAVGDGVAGGDPAEDVDEHALDGRVAQDDVQPVGHHLGRGAAADVEEVRRLFAPPTPPPA